MSRTQNPSDAINLSTPIQIPALSEEARTLLWGTTPDSGTER